MVLKNRIRPFLVRQALSIAYKKADLNFEKSRDYKANFYAGSFYTARSERNTEIDVVVRPSSIDFIEHSTDAREGPFTLKKYQSLSEFVKARMAYFIENLEPMMLAFMEHQMLMSGKGRMSAEQFIAANEKVKLLTAKSIAKADRASKNILILLISWVISL